MQRDSDLPHDFLNLPDGLSRSSSFLSSLSPTSTSPLASPFSLTHGIGLGTTHTTTELAGIDSATYMQVLHQHQTRLRQMGDEYEWLKCVAHVTIFVF